MQQAFKHIQSALISIYSESEINELAYQLLCAVTSRTRTDIILNKNTKISENQRLQFETFVTQLQAHKPIQYVLGTTEFYGMKFDVNPSVLIPRPETEELLEWIQTSCPPAHNYKMLDIGTGSGCIAIALKCTFSKSEITAFDISESALETARQNAILNGCNIDFRQIDILNPPIFDTQWDIIVSNPPYIPQNELETMDHNVRNFEPHTALFVPDANPLLFYEAIAAFALKHLNRGGMLFFEIHRDFGPQTVQLLQNLEFKDVVLRKDLSGNDRMLRATL